MAGSYAHCCKFPDDYEESEDYNVSFDEATNNATEFEFDTIENLGDAYEACEEMFGMVRFLSGGDPVRIQAARDHWGEPDLAIAQRSTLSGRIDNLNRAISAFGRALRDALKGD